MGGGGGGRVGGDGSGATALSSLSKLFLFEKKVLLIYNFNLADFQHKLLCRLVVRGPYSYTSSCGFESLCRHRFLFCLNDLKEKKMLGLCFGGNRTHV